MRDIVPLRITAWTTKPSALPIYLASAGLPQLFAPVAIDGEAYWNGSFVGNPPLAPLVDQASARDVLVILNNPIARRELPVSMADVHNRANEIAFNIAVVREFGAIDEETAAAVHIGAVRLHVISGTEPLREMRISSKFNTQWGFIRHLHDLGATAAERWLRDDFAGVGIASTFDPRQIYAPDTLGAGL